MPRDWELEKLSNFQFQNSISLSDNCFWWRLEVPDDAVVLWVRRCVLSSMFIRGQKDARFPVFTLKQNKTYGRRRYRKREGTLTTNPHQLNFSHRLPTQDWNTEYWILMEQCVDSSISGHYIVPSAIRSSSVNIWRLRSHRLLHFWSKHVSNPVFQLIGEMVILVFLSSICGIVNELSCLRRASAPLSAVASTSYPLGFR